MRTDSLAASALVLVAATAGDVAAAPTRKVEITTEPAGATVYLASKENGPACAATPCTIDAPIGDTPLIIELANHVSLVENLAVPKRDRKPLKVSFQLAAAVGTIKVDGPKGAKITIGDEDHGTAPTEIEVPAGQYIVVLTMRGKPIEQLPVDVEAGGEVAVVGSARDIGGSTPSDHEPTGGDAVTAKAHPTARPAIVTAWLAVDVGFRDFTYDNAQTTMTLSDEREPGVVLVGPAFELWLGNLFKVRSLRGLSLLGRLQFGVNKLTVTGGELMAPATTFWQSFEVSAKHRWLIGSSAAIEVGAGFVRDRFQFNGDVDDVRLLPDADYKSIRIGARAALRLGAWEPYVAAENRIVLSGGAIESRFDTAGTSGLRGALGLAARLGKVHARLEGALTRYRWTFGFETDDEFRADGGVDSIKLVALAIGYSY